MEKVFIGFYEKLIPGYHIELSLAVFRKIGKTSLTACKTFAYSFLLIQKLFCKAFRKSLSSFVSVTWVITLQFFMAEIEKEKSVCKMAIFRPINYIFKDFLRKKSSSLNLTSPVESIGMSTNSQTRDLIIDINRV